MQATQRVFPAILPSAQRALDQVQTNVPLVKVTTTSSRLNALSCVLFRSTLMLLQYQDSHLPVSTALQKWNNASKIQIILALSSLCYAKVGTIFRTISA